MGRENDQQQRRDDEWVVGRDEMNLAEFPLSVIGKRSPGDVKTLHFEDEVWDRSLEKYVPRRLTVTGSDLLGLPNSLDDEVLLGCIQLTKEDGFSDRRVRFTRYELMELIGWPRDGRSYQRISESLERWAGTLIISDKAFWDRKNNCWVKDSFNILDRVILSEREDLERTRWKRSAIIWGDFMWQSFQSGNLKSLDYRFWQSLQSPVSKRLYRLLDKRFHKRKAITFDLHRLAFDKVGLSRNMHTGQIKEKLKPAHEELKVKGVCDAKYVKRARGAWDVIYDDVRVSASRQLPDASKNNDSSASKLEDMLLARGLANAAELVSKYSEKKILEAIDNFDDRKAHGEDLGAGWLGKSIVSREPFGFRKGYKGKEAVRAELEKEAARIAKRNLLAEKAASDRLAINAVKKRKRSEFLAKVAHLSMSERDQLETEAIRRAHQAGDRFRADLVQRLRREGESLEASGVIRQQFWWEYILSPEETLNIEVTVAERES